MRTITLNIIKGYGLTPMLNVSQFDKGYTVVCTVQKDAEAFTPPTGSTATVEGRKPDNTGYQYPATIDGSTVTFTMAEQMTVLSGRSMAEIVFYDSDAVRIGTANFYIIVEAAPLNEETVISETELPAIIDAANANAERAEDAADEAAATLANFSTVVAEQVEQMQIHEGQTVIDGTLTVSGAAADAKATGDKVAELKNDLASYEELSIGYGVDRCNQDLVFGDRGQDGIFVASSSQLTTSKIIPVTPSTSYNISVYGAQFTGAIRYYKYSSTNESDFIGTGTIAANADGTVTITASTIDANTKGIAFRTSQTALAGRSCRVVASDQLEPLYDVLNNRIDTIDDRTENIISGIAAETEQIAPDNGVMTRYPVNGYINNDNGTFMANDRYICYYFTAPIDTDMWFDNDIATWGQIVVYNGTMFDTASLVTIKSLSRNNLPYVDSKLAVASDMTVVVCVLATGSFRLHYYDIRITPEQIKSIVKPPIRIVPTSATAFSVYVLCETSGEYLRHDFNRITYTDNLTYGDGQTKSLVTCDIWYASNIYDTDGNMIMQGNTNFIQSLNIEGHTGHVGAGHGCVVADWTLFFADGQQFDPTTLTETIECTAFRFTEKATHYLRDTATSPSPVHSYPTLDDNGNPIPVSIEYLDGEWRKNNRISIHNRLDIVYQTPFKFIQAHAGMCCGFYPYFSNVIFNNGEYLWNEFERDSGGTYSVSNPGGTATLLPLGSVASIGGDRIIIFGDKYRVTKAMTLLDPNRYGKSNMLIQTPPNADDRIKAYLMPCICMQSSAMISSGQAVETFTDGDRLEALVDMQLDAVS